ncbi:MULTISPECIES: hypothetical protein [Cupriavidus]
MLSSSTCEAAQTESVRDTVQRAVSALHGLRWAAGCAHSNGDIDAFLCLVDSLLPQLGVDLETVHSALGGKPIGYFPGSDTRGEVR